MLIKLYKQEEGKIFYWEAWDHEKVYTVHWGKAGETGDTKEVKNTILKRAINIVKDEEKSMRELGYKEIEDLKTIFIQYKIDGFGNEEDINKRYKIEDIMNEALGWTGLGHCDGGDIGSGTMNIFCLVVNIELASKIILRALKEEGYIDGALLIEDPGDEKIRLFWPENYIGEISY